MSTLVVASLSYGKSITAMFGATGENLLWIAVILHNYNLIIGGLGIAFFRLLVINYPSFAQNVQQ